jgi:hypothetical protein
MCELSGRGRVGAPRSAGRRRLVSAALLAAGAFAGLPGIASARSTSAPGASTPPPLATDIHVLDGKAFVGTFGPRGGSARDEDTFVFENGTFTSTGCIEYGFSPRPYWVRESDGVVHFLAEMISEEHGVIVYTGSVRGDVLKATYTWTRDRWYWTVVREFWFEGTLAKGR